LVPQPDRKYSRPVIRLGTAASVLLLTLASIVPARAQSCELGCDDGNECTTDSCDPVSSQCIHQPLDGDSCGDNGCVPGVCQGGVCVLGNPELDCVPCATNDDCEDGSACTIDTCNERGRCEREGAEGGTCDDEDPCTLDDRCTNDVCAGTPLVCDDGAACTADFCDAGTCVNAAESSSCPASTECATSECSPDDPAADAQGCVPRSGDLELSECSEDENPCTDDHCRVGACAHDAVADPQGCQPLLPSYRRAVLLRAGAERVLTYVLDEVDAGGDTGDRLVEQLEAMSADLDAATRVLAGRDAGSEPPTAAFRGLRLSPTATTAQQRGFIALAFLRGTPGRVQTFLGVVSQGRRRRELESDAAGELRRNGRILLAGTKALKGDLKNLQKTFSVFQR
jgi:Dictyostelium (slime mold) repeat